MQPRIKQRTRKNSERAKVVVDKTTTRTRTKIKEGLNGHTTTLIWWPTPVQETDAGITTLKDIKGVGQVQRRFWRVHVLNTPETGSVVIPWGNVWIYSVVEPQDQAIGTTTMDIEETMVMEDPATMA